VCLGALKTKKTKQKKKKNEVSGLFNKLTCSTSKAQGGGY